MAESPFRHAHADDSPGFLLWKLTSLWQGEVALTLQRFGLTQTQYALLASLRWLEEHDGPPTQSHLAAHAEIEKMTLSKAVRRLEELGLVVRRASTRDARATEVTLTATGGKVVEEAVRAVEETDDRFFGALDADALQAWLAHTRRVVDRNRARGEDRSS